MLFYANIVKLFHQAIKILDITEFSYIFDPMENIENIKAARRARTAQEISDALKASGLSRKEFAGKMGRMPSEVTKWLSGDHNFTSNLLAEISHVLGKPISGVAEELHPVRISDRVHGYVPETPAVLRDVSAVSLADIEIPADIALSLNSKAESKGMTFRQFILELLCRKASEKSEGIVDYAGSLDCDFPSIEEIRNMRTTNARVECDIF